MAALSAAVLVLLIGSSPSAGSSVQRDTRIEDSGVRGGAAGASGADCKAPGTTKSVCRGKGSRGGSGQDHFLLQREIQRSSVATSGGESACLCVFDIDRTLTAKQGSGCPGSEPVRNVWDSAYSGGWLTLSALAAAGMESTFCGSCYLGVVSAGGAGGEYSEERKVLVKRVLTNSLQRALARRTSMAQAWSYSGRVLSPFVLHQPDRTKQHAVVEILGWYQQQGIRIENNRVHFFGDRTENIGPFQDAGFNAREISCGSRDWSLHNGMVGLCGATPQEIVPEVGVKTCSGEAERPEVHELDSSPGHNGGGGNLQVCQGDCDSDSDCAGGLRCFQRTANEGVPGCRGSGIWGFDYCFEPHSGSTPGSDGGRRGDRKLDSSPGHGGGSGNLQVCQGDCDADSDCASGLRCYQRHGLESVPGCDGQGVWSFDYCYEPVSSQSAGSAETGSMPEGAPSPGYQPTGHAGSTANPSPSPAAGQTSGPSRSTHELDSSPGQHAGGGNLRACQGDCDSDSDCAPGLRCYQRDGHAAVPGCTGEGTWDYDYCYDPVAEAMASARGARAHAAASSGPRELDSSPGQHGGQGRGSLQVCQGDCDTDNDCAAGLRCFYRNGHDPVPGCTGRGVWNFDYCHEPPVVEIGSNFEAPPPEGGAGPRELDSSPGQHGQGKPLSACRGDCDQDSDCAGGLRCFQRSGMEPVPGCSGQGIWDFDYCYDPSAGR